VKVRFSPRARRRANAIEKWWRAHRPKSPDLFQTELAAATRQLSSTPTVGIVYQTVRGKQVQRLLLPKSEQHLYYWVDEKGREVVLMTIWGARRGRPPKL
jgi:plasmid stabilization system protein ParE